MTEDEMVGWQHQLHGHEFQQTLGDSEGQEAWCFAMGPLCHGTSFPWDCKELDMSE